MGSLTDAGFQNALDLGAQLRHTYIDQVGCRVFTIRSRVFVEQGDTSTFGAGACASAYAYVPCACFQLTSKVYAQHVCHC